MLFGHVITLTASVGVRPSSVCPSVCLSHRRILNVTHKVGARDAASIHFCPSMTIIVTFATFGRVVFAPPFTRLSVS